MSVCDTFWKHLRNWKVYKNNNRSQCLTIINDISELFEDKINNFEKQHPDPMALNPSAIEHGDDVRKLTDALIEHEKGDASRDLLDIFDTYITEDCVPSLMTTAVLRLWLNCISLLDNRQSQLKNGFLQTARKLFEMACWKSTPLNAYAIGILAKILKDEHTLLYYKQENLKVLKHFLPDMLKKVLPNEGLQAKRKTKQQAGSPPPKLLKSNKEKRINSGDNVSSNITNQQGHDLPLSETETGPYWELSRPLSNTLKHRLYLDFLSSVGSDQFCLNTLLEHKAIEIAFHLVKNGTSYIQFKAFQFLGTICCHTKCAFEILQSNCMELAISKRSLENSTGASLFLYELAKNEEALKKISSLTKFELVVEYALSLVKGTHISAACNVALFFSEALQYENILNSFDKFHGVKKLVNFLKCSEMFSLLYENIEYTETNTSRHVLSSFSICFERYFIKHLLLQLQNLITLFSNSPWQYLCTSVLKRAATSIISNLSLYELEESIEFLRRVNCIPDPQIKPVIADIVHNGQHIKEVSEDKLSVEVLIKMVSIGVAWPEMYCALQVRQSSLTSLMILTVSNTIKPLLLHAYCAESLLLYAPTSYIGLLLDILTSKKILKLNAGKWPTTPSLSGQRLNTNFVNHGLLCQRLAMQTLLTCVYQPGCNTSTEHFVSKLQKDHLTLLNENNGLNTKFRNDIQQRCGIMALTLLLQEKVQTEIDILICKVLYCLVQQSCHCKQVMANLPLFSKGNFLFLLKPNYSGSKKEDVIFTLMLHNLVCKLFGKHSYHVQQVMSKLHLQPLAISYLTEERMKYAESDRSLSKSYRSRTNAALEEKMDQTREFNKICFTKGSKCKGKGLSLLPTSYTVPRVHKIQNLQQQIMTPNNKVGNKGFSFTGKHTNVAVGNFYKQLNLQQPHAMNKWDNEYVFSKFSPAYSVHDEYGYEPTYMSSVFYDNGNKLLIGDDKGRLTIHNINSHEKDEVYSNVGDMSIISLYTNKAADALIVNCSDKSCSHWLMYRLNPDAENYFNVVSIDEWTNDFHAEFAKKRNDRALGSRHGQAKVFDLNTGKMLFSLYKEDSYDNQSWYRATYSWDDNLILSNSMLWDPRVTHDQPIHQFDVFSDQGTSLFHPNGTEIILNASIWDMRNYNLVHTVPEFDCSKLYFNSTGSVIFSVKVKNPIYFNERFIGSNVASYCAHDYKYFDTLELKNDIINFACDSLDRKISLVEKIRKRKSNLDTKSSDDDDDDINTKCTLYDIGTLNNNYEDDHYPFDEHEVWEPTERSFLFHHGEVLDGIESEDESESDA